MESSNGVSVENAVIGNNDKNSTISNIKTLANTGDGKKGTGQNLKRKMGGRRRGFTTLKSFRFFYKSTYF